MAAHRYWRIIALSPAGTDLNWCIAEAQFRSTPGTPLLFSGGAAFASSVYTGTNAATSALGADNNASTFWASIGPSVGEWWGYDYGAGNSIDVLEFTLTTRNDSFFPQGFNNFSLQFSDDNSTWTTAKSFTAATWTIGQTQTFAVAQVDTPASGALKFTGFAPTWSGGIISTQARFTQIGVEAWVSNTPTARFTQIGVEVWRSTADAIPSGLIKFTGFAPSVDPSASPAAGLVRFSGFAPSNVISSPPPSGAMLFTGFAPTVPIIANAASPIVVVMG